MPKKQYDVFIAHSSKDKPQARDFKQALLDGGLRPFIDEDMLPGTLWDDALPAAQEGSRVTAVLISDNLTKAYYAREEIVAAIQLFRKDQQVHQVVPIFLDGEVPENLPYGLKRTVGVSLPMANGWSKIVRRIKQLLAALDDPSKVDRGFTPDPADTPIKGSELVKLSDGIARAVVELGLAPDSILLCVDFPMHQAPMAPNTAATYWLDVVRRINSGILASGSGRAALRELVHAIRAHAPEVSLPPV